MQTIVDARSAKIPLACADVEKWIAKMKPDEYAEAANQLRAQLGRPKRKRRKV